MASGEARRLYAGANRERINAAKRAAYHRNGDTIRRARRAKQQHYTSVHRAWAEKNREHLREVDRKRNNSDKRRAEKRAARDQWSPERRAIQREYAREWRRRNPGRRNRELERLNSAARRARIRGQFVEHVHPLVVLERADGLCGICGTDVDPFDFHVDHVIPIARGGGHSYANVQLAHPGCNHAKRAELPDYSSEIISRC